MNSVVERVLSALRSRGIEPRRVGSSWQARCPAHDDVHPSLSIAEGATVGVVLNCFAGCSFESVCAALGLEPRDLMSTKNGYARRFPGRRGVADRGVMQKHDPKSDKRAQVLPTLEAAIASVERRRGPRAAEWSYTRADGEAVGVVVRWNLAQGGKSFAQLSRTEAGWIARAMPAPRPLYRLPELARATRILITEGEKAADAVRSLGLIATTCAGGANAVRMSDWSILAGHSAIVILPDNDLPGLRYAEQVAGLLAKLHPRPMIKIVALPGLPPKGDFVEFLAARRESNFSDDAIRAELEDLVAQTPNLDSNPGSSAVLVTMSDVCTTPITWLWPERIPRGKLTLLIGDPNLGKSLVTLDLAARASRGLPWPDAPDAANAAGGVVLLSAEDDIADTIRPRLDAAGADCTRIRLLEAVRRRDHGFASEYERHFDLQQDIDALEDAICKTPDCALCVIDPLSAYLGRIDAHKNAEVRAGLSALANLAARTRVAVVCVTHLNKSAAMAPIYRASGSLAFIAAARAAWLIAPDPADHTRQRRLLLPLKSNLAASPSGLAYTIMAELGGPIVRWDTRPVSTTAEEALAGETGQHGPEALLRELLREGVRPAQEVLEAGKAEGFSEAVIRGTFKRIGGRRKRSGFGLGGIWNWCLPSVADSEGSATIPDDQSFEADGTATYQNNDNNENYGNYDGKSDLDPESGSPGVFEPGDASLRE